MLFSGKDQLKTKMIVDLNLIARYEHDYSLLAPDFIIITFACSVILKVSPFAPDQVRTFTISLYICRRDFGIWEKFTRNEIVEHVSQNNLFTEVQHGFIKGKSCVTQLLEFKENY